MRENIVKNLFIVWLNKNGYRNVQETRPNEQYDIYAEKDGSRWYFEVKGCPQSKKTENQQMVHYFQGALGKMIQIMNAEETNRYGIVFPDIGVYERKILRLHPATRKKLSISFYLINAESIVRRI